MFYLLTRLQYDFDFKFVSRMEISIPSEKLKSVLEEKIDNCQPQEALVSKQETATLSEVIRVEKKNSKVRLG